MGILRENGYECRFMIFAVFCMYKYTHVLA